MSLSLPGPAVLLSPPDLLGICFPAQYREQAMRQKNMNALESLSRLKSSFLN
jgi:hypothetical protein